MDSTEISQLKKERETLLNKLSQFAKEDESTPVKEEAKKLMIFSQIFDERRLNEEEPKLNEPDKAVVDVLNLNEKLIMTLEKADQQIQALSQLNTKMSADVQDRENKLEAYKQAEVQAKQAQYDKKLNEVHFQWCETFSLKDTNQQQEAKRMLSTFDSEDKLETIKSFLENKTVQMADTPQQITKQSEELNISVKEKSVKPWELEKMSAEERKNYTDMIYEKMVKATK